MTVIVNPQQACLQDQLKFTRLPVSVQRVPGLILGGPKVANMQDLHQRRPHTTVRCREAEIMLPIEHGAANIVLLSNLNSEIEGPAAATGPGEDTHLL